METTSTQVQANQLVNLLNRVAALVDADYSDACGESSCSNREPKTDAERLVWLLHWAALEVNGSGLCDSGQADQPWRGYGAHADLRNDWQRSQQKAARPA